MQGPAAKAKSLFFQTASQPALLSIAAYLRLNGDPQAQASLDEEMNEYPQQQNSQSDRHFFTRQDSASSNVLPGKEAAGFTGAFKKVANGIAGSLQYVVHK